jgi:transposase
VTDIHGIGPLGAAIILGHTGDIDRFPTSGHFARYTGSAPIAASSGPKQRHRLNPRGNRQLNRALHVAAVVILDNLSAHKSQPVRDWLAHKKRRRWHLHFTPTSSSWLNLVECWFSVLSRKALTNTSFTSVAELETRIDCWVSHWNDNPEPFVWTKPADEIRQSRPRTSHPRPDHQIRDTPLARIARGGGLRVREKPS